MSDIDKLLKGLNPDQIEEFKGHLIAAAAGIARRGMTDAGYQDDNDGTVHFPFPAEGKTVIELENSTEVEFINEMLAALRGTGFEADLTLPGQNTTSEAGKTVSRPRNFIARIK